MNQSYWLICRNQNRTHCLISFPKLHVTYHLTWGRSGEHKQQIESMERVYQAAYMLPLYFSFILGRGGGTSNGTQSFLSWFCVWITPGEPGGPYVVVLGFKPSQPV